jgi:hypothetical protein
MGIIWEQISELALVSFAKTGATLPRNVACIGARDTYIEFHTLLQYVLA